MDLSVSFLIRYRIAMVAPETELAMVQRHVRQGERRVSRQREIIAEIAFRMQSTRFAKTLLINFENCLDGHKEHLARLILN